MNALERARQIAARTKARALARERDVPAPQYTLNERGRLDINYGVGDGPFTCAECTHGHMRVQHEGHITIHIGKPEMRCMVDQQYRSAAVPHNCPAFVRKG